MTCRNIRPGSILFFPKESKERPRDGSQAAKALEYDEPMFVGFGNARPDRVTQTVTDGYRKSEAAGAIHLDVYQHPAKRDDPNIRYSRSFDIYSLGCVLLEIARWQLLEEIAHTNGTKEGFKRRLQEAANRSEG